MESLRRIKEPAGLHRPLTRLQSKKQAGRIARSACFLRNRARSRRGRDTGNPRDPRSAIVYLLRRATFFAPLLALCDLWAPLRDFVDLRTMCFFVEVFLDFLAEERFAAISTISFVGSGAYGIRAAWHRHPKKAKQPSSDFVAASGSQTPCCHLRWLASRVGSMNWTCVASEGRTYSGIEKTGQAKILRGQAVWNPRSVANREDRGNDNVERPVETHRSTLDNRTMKPEI
jgi:hypothetical protein